MNDDKINYYDTSFLTPLFTVKQYHASTYDWHPSALVHQKIGEMLSEYILNNFLDKACPKKLVRFYPDRNNRIMLRPSFAGQIRQCSSRHRRLPGEMRFKLASCASLDQGSP